MENHIITEYILDFLKENQFWIFITIITTLICNPIEMIVLSDLFSNFTGAINGLEYSKSITILLKIAGLSIFVDSVYMISNYFDKIYYPLMEKFIRFRLIDVIFKNIEVNYEKEDISNHIIKTLKIPNTVTSFTGRFIYWVVTFVLTSVVILGYIIYLNPVIGSMTVLVFILFFILYYYILLDTKNTSEKRENEEKNLMSNIDDVLSNSISIICNKKIKDEKEYLTQKHDIYDNAHETQLWSTSKGGFAMSVIVTLILVVYVYVILRLYKSKSIDSTSTIKVIIIMLFFVRYIKTASQRSILVIAEYGKLAENESNIRKLMIDDNSTHGNKTGVPITGHIEFKNVSFEYTKNPEAIEGSASIGETRTAEDRKKTLDNVSFKIKPLDRVAIIGTNGSGKSTIIKLLSGFFKPTEGQILFDGEDIQNIDREYLRSKLSIVSQKVVLFNRSVIDNICYATETPKEEVVDILDRLKIMNVFKKLPQGLDTMAGSRGENLSGGQRQIIYLLRSYLSNKPITIMDEPTAAVDAFHKKYVAQMINEMSKKTTMIIVTHDSEFAATFPVKIFIESGRIVKLEGTGSNTRGVNRTVAAVMSYGSTY
ncbi:ABC transporter ATP-binding protein [bacterium]|nr:ABC transporter ATP-binding protein [bacterium]